MTGGLAETVGGLAAGGLAAITGGLAETVGGLVAVGLAIGLGGGGLGLAAAHGLMGSR